MPTLFFHCTDGRTLVLDRRGEEVRAGSRGLQLAFARFAAHAVRDLRPERQDWSGWRVHVVDEAGDELALVPFDGEPRFFGAGERRLFAERVSSKEAQDGRPSLPPLAA